MPRQRRAAACLVAAAACVALMAGCAQPIGAASFFDQLVPVEEVSDFLRQGGEVVGLMRDGVAEAYEEMSSSFSDFVAKAANNLHPNNLIPGTSSSSSCDNDGDETLGEDCEPLDPDAKRNVSEIIRSRGFEAQEFEVVTRDGYILTIQRIINPNVDEAYRKRLKPAILQHGLMSSSVDWVINSVQVKPSKWPRKQPAARGGEQTRSGNSIEEHQRQARGAAKRNLAELVSGDSQEQPNSLGFYLANEGYDVFLANSRGNIYGQKHANMSSWQPAFWDFTFDEQIKYDLPDIIEFVQQLTGHQKVGYVGHSQGTTMALGLLSDQPNYADVLEPVVLLAPVAYANNCKSPVKYFAVYTPIFQHINMWFGSSNVAVRYLAPKVCSPDVIRRDVCANIIFLSCGFDEAQFDESRAPAYLSHMPSGTSVKNIAHWGQEVLSGRFAHFDHGILGNQARYGLTKPPEYDLTKIRSKSLALFVADNDWLASPKDVARLRNELQVQPFAVHNITEFVPAWNHIDFVYGKDAGRLVNSRILEVFHHFD